MRRPPQRDGESLTDADDQGEQDPLAVARALICDSEGSADKALLAACKEGLGVGIISSVVSSRSSALWIHNRSVANSSTAPR